MVADVLSPMRPTLETTVTSRLRELDAGSSDEGSQGYLTATDGLAARADLTSGRWPAERGRGAGSRRWCRRRPLACSASTSATR